METPFRSWQPSHISRDHLTNPKAGYADNHYHSYYDHGEPCADTVDIFHQIMVLCRDFARVTARCAVNTHRQECA